MWCPRAIRESAAGALAFVTLCGAEAVALIMLCAVLFAAPPGCRADSRDFPPGNRTDPREAPADTRTAARVASGAVRAAPAQSVSPVTYPIRFYQHYISNLRYGHCRFEPSCSQYAIEAVNEFGFFKGSALAADRLVRCGGRSRDYAKSPSGKLLDSPAGKELPCHRPRVPEWLLPARADSIPSADQEIAVQAIVTAAGADSQHALRRILQWDVAFAHALATKGDCERAETEYERLAFYSGSQAMQRWAAMMAGWCYFRAGEWTDAASRFTEAEHQSRTPREACEASFMVAAARFNEGDYEESERMADSSCSGSDLAADSAGDDTATEIPAAGAAEAARKTPRGGAITETARADAIRAEFLGALCSMSLGSWKESADRFARIAAESSAPREKTAALSFAERSLRGLELPSKNPTVAVVMSTILPGAGQFYAGRPYDGLRHFLFDALLIFSVVQLMRDEDYAAGYLLASFTLPFYAGNIMGAKRSVDRFNACRRLEYVSDTARLAGAR
jgi:putative membrane protein insertion efficiency factor